MHIRSALNSTRVYIMWIEVLRMPITLNFIALHWQWNVIANNAMCATDIFGIIWLAHMLMVAFIFLRWWEWGNVGQIEETPYVVPIWMDCYSEASAWPQKTKETTKIKKKLSPTLSMRQLFTSAKYKLKDKKENERPQRYYCRLYVQNTRVPYNFFAYDDVCRRLIGDASKTPYTLSFILTLWFFDKIRRD